VKLKLGDLHRKMPSIAGCRMRITEWKIKKLGIGLFPITKPMARALCIDWNIRANLLFMTFFPLKPLHFVWLFACLAAAASAQQKENFQFVFLALDQTAKFPTTLL